MGLLSKADSHPTTMHTVSIWPVLMPLLLLLVEVDATVQAVQVKT